MLQRQAAGGAPLAYPDQAHRNTDIGLPELIAFLQRRWAPIMLGIGAALLLACVYLLVAPTQYSAETTVLIDPRKIEIFGRGDVSAEAAITSPSVESEVQLLQSGTIAGAVVDKLGLTRDPQFMQGDPGLSDMIKRGLAAMVARLFPPPAQRPPTEEELRLRAADMLKGNLEVSRVELSYAITVTCFSKDPKEAVRLANAVAEAYLADSAERRRSAAMRLSEWLQDRLQDLRRQGYAGDSSAEEKSAFRATYDSFLQRYTETVQQQSLPSTETRVITPATSAQKRWPRASLVLAGALILGTALGGAIALARELLDRTVRSRQQLESATGLPCLGLLPIFRSKRSDRRALVRRSKTLRENPERAFSLQPQYSVTLRAPFSRYAETLRGVRVAAESNAATSPLSVLGITSSSPREGRTTVAINLARVVARNGVEVLLIDGDLRNPALSRNLVPPGTPGLVQHVADDVPVADMLWTDPETSLKFLPAGSDGELLDASEILRSGRMKNLVEELRQRYSIVVVDLPPLLPVVDVRAAAHLFDAFALVVEWGITTEDVVRDALHGGGIEDKVVGTLLNKVNLSRIRRFEPHVPALAASAYPASSRAFA